jgi:phospholipid/cholesterol/gamma-HCH transport system permease protein
MKTLLMVIDEIGGAVLFLKTLMDVLFRKKLVKANIYDQVWKVTVDSFPTTAMA